MDYTTLGKEPIPGDSETGSNCRYEAEFESLQTEIDKMSLATATGKVDWALVVKTAAGILQTISKDLTVASYLAVGLLHTQKINGLDQGIQILNDLVQTYWDKLFPTKKRMRGRLGAFEWWLEKTEEVLQQIKVKPVPIDQIERINENLKSLDELLMEKMPEPPLLRPVQRQIEAVPVQQAAKAAPEPEPKAEKAQAHADGPKTAAPKPAASAPTASAPVAQAPVAVGTDQEARKSVNAALQQLQQTSWFMLQQNLKSPMAYRFRRLASWASLEVIPPHTDGATQIPPPPPQVVSELQALRDEGNWPALVMNSEQKVSQFIFWFDLSCQVAEGLKHLGPDYKNARAAVCQETAYLLHRFPGLDNLTFSDGTAFAEPGTRKWLQSVSFGEGSAGDDRTGGSAEDEEYTAVVQKALAMARKKRVADAVSLLQNEMEVATSGGRQMRWRLAIAQVLLVVKKSQLAVPHIDQVLADIDAHHLERWDPQLAVEGLTMAWKGYSVQGIDAHKLRAQEILGRIAKIDPSRALGLQK